MTTIAPHPFIPICLKRGEGGGGVQNLSPPLLQLLLLDAPTRHTTPHHEHASPRLAKPCQAVPKDRTLHEERERVVGGVEQHAKHIPGLELAAVAPHAGAVARTAVAIEHPALVGG